MLELLFELQEFLAEIAGLPAVSLQPAAGPQGELTGLLLVRAYFRDRGEPSANVLVTADTAHGTNPACVDLAGFEPVTVKTTAAASSTSTTSRPSSTTGRPCS